MHWRKHVNYQYGSAMTVVALFVIAAHKMLLIFIICATKNSTCPIFVTHMLVLNQ